MQKYVQAEGWFLEIDHFSNPLFFVDTDTPGIVEIVSVYLNADSTSINQNISIAAGMFQNPTELETKENIFTKVLY